MAESHRKEILDAELKPGATMPFTFPDAAPLEAISDGEIFEFDPATVYAFRWNTDVLRFELVQDGSGCRLMFSIHDTGDGYRVPFDRDLIWKPVDEVWALLTEGTEPRVHVRQA